MNNIEHNFQLVILESPYEIWNLQSVPLMFSKMIKLKKDGYDSHYLKKVLPLDTSDFIATHVLLCRKQKDQSLEPIMGYKTVTVKKCQEYNFVYPGLGLVTNAKMPLHIQAVNNIIQRCEHEQKNLAYLGSWTIDPTLKDPLLRKQLKKAFQAFYGLLYREQKVSEVIIGGTLRFHTEKIFSELGQKPLQLNGEDLPVINVKHLGDEPVLVMHGACSSDPLTETEHQWNAVWSNRIHFEKKQIQYSVPWAA